MSYTCQLEKRIESLGYTREYFVERSFLSEHDLDKLLKYQLDGVDEHSIGLFCSTIHKDKKEFISGGLDILDVAINQQGILPPKTAHTIARVNEVARNLVFVRKLCDRIDTTA